jgi:hypothetical protein
MSVNGRMQVAFPDSHSEMQEKSFDCLGIRAPEKLVVMCENYQADNF